VIRNFASAIREENFKYTPHPSGYANPRISENTPLNIKAETYFTDTVANPNAVGVFVKQTVSGRRNAPHRKYVIFEYDIKNISAAAFDSLNVGIFADWDIQDAVNLANWDNIGKFGYIYKDTSYTAIKVLSTTAFNHFAFDVVSSSASGNINILDSFTKGEKWRAASGGLARNFAGTLSGPSGNNTAHYVGTSIANITPGESRKVYFAFLIGNSLADLRQSAIEAQNAVNPSVSPIPVFTDSVFCSGEPFLISPSGGTNFAFYSPWNPITPLHIGNSYLIPADSVLNTFLVTCRDSVVESAPRWINFDLVTPTVDFSAPASVVIPDVSSVSFTSLATSAVSWTWDFGNDTFSNLENPSAVYTSSGVYMVTLTATDNNGCTGSVSKSITVARRSPTPVITPVYHFVCWEENVVISPLNGSIFKFYKNSALTQLVSQGNSVSVHDPMIQSVWITCIDSLLESLPVKVDIRRSYVRAEFQAAPIFDTVLYADVNFNDFSVSDLSLVQWEWNFGDGTAFSSDRNPEHTYSTQGIYEVTLRARNSKGCWGEIKRKFKVGKRSPVPILRDYAADVCVGGYAYMFPLNGTKYNYYTDVALSDKIYSGKNYAPLITESTPNVFYITCADSLIESAPTAFRINKKQAVADFEYPREVLMHINNRASFIDLSKDAVEWEWDFGNGSVAYNKNPTAIYRGQGTYTVKLKIKNSSGCFAAVSKKIVVVNKSPEPQVPSYKICSNDKVHIKPTGGKVFKFYTDEFAPKHIHVGNSYETPRLGKNTTYFITCVDSAIESSAVRCEIILSRPISNFTMSEDSLNLFRTDTVFFRDQSQFAKRWLWNFDNGKNAFVPNTFSRYFNKRHYRVSLITFDSLNCLDTMRKTLIVYDSAVVASLNPDDEYDFAIFPIPAKDRINIAFSKYGHKPITYTLTNATGMSVLKVSEHFSVLSFETISTAHLPRGLYILRLKIGEKIFNRKIVLD
jgi:PKD repeat protein